jgi:hypothetical protein
MEVMLRRQPLRQPLDVKKVVMQEEGEEEEVQMHQHHPNRARIISQHHIISHRLIKRHSQVINLNRINSLRLIRVVMMGHGGISLVSLVEEVVEAEEMTIDKRSPKICNCPEYLLNVAYLNIIRNFYQTGQTSSYNSFPSFSSFSMRGQAIWLSLYITF